MSSSWAAEGQRLRQFKKEMNAKLRPGVKKPGDAADFAYQSEPVNISAPGKYLLHFGPVDDSFDYPRSPTALTYEFPPDMKFTVLLSGPIQIGTLNGNRYLEVGVTVSNFSAPYSNFTGWIY